MPTHTANGRNDLGFRGSGISLASGALALLLSMAQGGCAAIGQGVPDPQLEIELSLFEPHTPHSVRGESVDTDRQAVRIAVLTLAVQGVDVGDRVPRVSFFEGIYLVSFPPAAGDPIGRYTVTLAAENSEVLHVYLEGRRWMARIARAL